MIYRVTHTDPTGQRRRARVSAPSVWAAIDQMNDAFGLARAVACVRMSGAPALRLVARGAACAL